MSRPKPEHPESPRNEIAAVNRVIAEALRPVALNPERAWHLGRQLMDRVRHSAVAHRDLTTVRREDGVWLTPGPGVRQRVLHQAAGLRVQLVQLAPHVAWHGVPDAQAMEVLVVEGEAARVHAPGHAVALGRWGHAVTAQVPQALGWRAGAGGAQLYVRSRLVGLAQLPAAEAQWWHQAQQQPVLAAAQPLRWAPFVAGAQALALQTHGGVASMLLRIAPGARLPDHGHALDEDCFMLDGDMYLGDVLLRAGDYQLARAGGGHVGITSDEGGLFYFHGALPEAAP